MKDQILEYSLYMDEDRKYNNTNNNNNNNDNNIKPDINITKDIFIEKFVSLSYEKQLTFLINYYEYKKMTSTDTKTKYHFTKKIIELKRKKRNDLLYELKNIDDILNNKFIMNLFYNFFKK